MEQPAQKDNIIAPASDAQSASTSSQAQGSRESGGQAVQNPSSPSPEQVQKPTLPKLPNIKSPLLLAALVAFLLLAGILIFGSFKLRKNISQVLPSPTSQVTDNSMPKEGVPVSAVNGKILAIKTDGNKTIFETSSYSTPWQKTWQVTLSEKTILVDEDGWQANSVSGDSPIAGVQKPSEKTVSNLTVGDFKVGDVIYMMAAEGQDFRNEGIDGPATIVKLKL